jgi:hypothetical protein
LTNRYLSFNYRADGLFLYSNSHMSFWESHTRCAIVSTKILSEVGKVLEKSNKHEKDPKQYEYGQGYYDDLCLARFLKGVCCRYIVYPVSFIIFDSLQTCILTFHRRMWTLSSTSLKIISYTMPVSFRFSHVIALCLIVLNQITSLAVYYPAKVVTKLLDNNLNSLLCQENL